MHPDPARAEPLPGLRSSLADVRLALSRAVALYFGAALFDVVMEVLVLGHGDTALAPPLLGLVVVGVALAVSATLGRALRPATGLVPLALLLALAVGVSLAGSEDAARSFAPLVAPAIGAAALAAGPVGSLLAIVVLGSSLAAMATGAPGGPPPEAWSWLAETTTAALGMAVVFAFVEGSAARVDGRTARTLVDYRALVRRHAADAERAEVDGLVHDRVLASFLAASRAQTQQERRLATEMAAEAILALRTAAHLPRDPRRPQAAAAFAHGLADAAETLDADVAVEFGDLGELAVPAEVAEALHAAGLQALVNSVAHAGAGAHRRLRIARADDGVRVEVEDDGVGFDPATLRSGALGLRISILERVENVDGDAEVHAAPGAGTRIVLRWTPRAGEATA